jgi:hypothetical protein
MSGVSKSVMLLGKPVLVKTFYDFDGEVRYCMITTRTPRRQLYMAIFLQRTTQSVFSILS